MRARAVVAAACVAAAGLGVATTASAAPPQPLDPQNWSFQDNLTWSDYKPIPGPDYNDPSDPADGQEVEGRADPGRLSRPAVHGHPGGGLEHLRQRRSVLAHSVPREQVPQFYADFLNKPTALNNFQTHEPVLDGELLRALRRRAGAVRPVPDAGRSATSTTSSNFQNATADCPNPTRATPNPEPCGLNFFNAARGAWEAAVPGRRARDVRQQYWMSAGQDECAALAGVRRDALRQPGRGDRPVRPEGHRPAAPARELGARRATSRGPRGPRPPTSGRAPAAASSTEAESSGMAVYAHELSHNLGIPDNYNNPFTRAVPARPRAACGT